MQIEDPQVNISQQKRAAKKARGGNSDPLPANPENLDEVEMIVNSRLFAIDKRLRRFLSVHPTFDGEETISEFNQLRGYRHKIELELADMIENFGSEGKVRINKITGGKERNIEKISLEISGEKKKEDLKFKVILFSVLHNYCDGLLRNTDQNRNIGKNAISKHKNEFNLSQAEIQQFVAMSIIRNPKENYPLFKEMSNKLKKIYNLTPRQEGSLEGGIIGLVGAYHYYRSKGFKVLFPQPKTDASKETDLFLVKWGLLTPEEKEELSQEGIEQIDGLSEEIRKQIYKVQVKCHQDTDKPTNEIIYDFEKNKAFKGEANLLEGIDKYSVLDYDYRPDEDYLFFKNQCQGLTNGRYLDLRIDDIRIYFGQKEDRYNK